MTTLTATTLGTIRAFEHSLDGGVDKKHNAAQVINVKDFGATGDGLTDDTTAIQNAIDAAYGGPFDAAPGTGGGNGSAMEDNFELYFPPGKYVITQSLVVCNTIGARIYGGGVGITELLFEADGDEGQDIVDDPVTPLWMVDGFLHCTVENMTWSSGATPFLTKTAAAGMDVDEIVLTVADTSDIVVGMLVYNFTKPDRNINGQTVTAILSGTTVELSLAPDEISGAPLDTDIGDTIYFVTQCMGIFLYQSSARGPTSTVTFRNLEINNFGRGVVGYGAAQCDNMVFENVVFNYCALCALKVNTFNVVNWGVFGGGAHNCALATTHKPIAPGNPVNGNFGAAYCIQTGSTPTIMGIHTSGNGWAMMTGSTQGQLLIGARMEDRQAVALQGATVFMSGCEFTGGDDTNGARILNAVFSGYFSAHQCRFAPASAVSPATPANIVELGTNGRIVFRECTFDGHADDLGIQGGGNARVSMFRCEGPSMPTASTLFASFAGTVDDYDLLDGCTVTELPTAHAKFKGLRGWVTDANATTYMSTVAGGGSNIVKVFCNGTNWVIG